MVRKYCTGYWTRSAATFILGLALVLGVASVAQALTCQASGSVPTGPPVPSTGLAVGDAVDIAIQLFSTSTSTSGGVDAEFEAGGTISVFLSCLDDFCVTPDPGVLVFSSCDCVAGVECELDAVDPNLVHINATSAVALPFLTNVDICTIHTTVGRTTDSCTGSGADRFVVSRTSDLQTNDTDCTPNVSGTAGGSTSYNAPLVCEGTFCNPSACDEEEASPTFGTCQPGTEPECPGDTCLEGFCNTETQACDTRPDPDLVGTECGPDGECVHQVCGSGDQLGQCVTVPDPSQNGNVCDEGDICTVGICQDGECVTVPDPTANGTECGPGDTCNDQVCQDGQCVTVPANEGGTCGEGDQCNEEVCQAGQCVTQPANEGEACTPTGEFDPQCQEAVCIVGVCTVRDQDPLPSICQGDEGCTPGFWKANADNKGAGAWPIPTGTLLSSVFTIPPCLQECTPDYDTITFRRALSLQGGSTLCQKAQILYRAAAAAYLNASSECIAYPLSAAQVVEDTNEAAASCTASTIITEAGRLDGFNNLGCPISQQTLNSQCGDD